MSRAGATYALPVCDEERDSHVDPLQAQPMGSHYDRLIACVQQASQEMAKGHHLASGVALYQALGILADVRRTLDRETGKAEAEHLGELCHSMHEELVQGNLKRRLENLESVLTQLIEMREAWGPMAGRDSNNE